MVTGKEMLNKLEKGLKNKHYSAKDIQDLVFKYRNIKSEIQLKYSELKQIEIKAGYFDKNKNIFLEEDKQ